MKRRRLPNPTWPGKTHPDFFSDKDTGVAVRDDEMEEYEALDDVLKEKLDELCEAFADAVDKMVDADQEYMYDDADELGQYFDAYFEPWLQDHVDEALEDARQNARIGEVLEKLEEQGLSEDQLLEFFLRTDLYEGQLKPYTYYSRGVYSVSDDQIEREYGFRDMLDWAGRSAPLKELVAWCDRHYDDLEWDVYKYAEKKINRAASNFSIRLNGDDTAFQYVIFSLSVSFEVNFNEDNVLEALADEFGGVEFEKPKVGPAHDDIAYKYSGSNDSVAGASGKGMYVARLHPNAKGRTGDLQRESRELGHCIGSEANGHPRALREGLTKVYSIRTESGKRKFTIELQRQFRDSEHFTIAEVKGKANRLAGFEAGKAEFTKPDDLRLVTDFLLHLGYSPEDIAECRDVAPGVKAMQAQGIDPFAPPPKKVRAPKQNPAPRLPRSVERLYWEAYEQPMGDFEE